MNGDLYLFNNDYIYECSVTIDIQERYAHIFHFILKYKNTKEIFDLSKNIHIVFIDKHNTVRFRIEKYMSIIFSPDTYKEFKKLYIISLIEQKRNVPIKLLSDRFINWLAAHPYLHNKQEYTYRKKTMAEELNAIPVDNDNEISDFVIGDANTSYESAKHAPAGSTKNTPYGSTKDTPCGSVKDDFLQVPLASTKIVVEHYTKGFCVGTISDLIFTTEGTHLFIYRNAENGIVFEKSLNIGIEINNIMLFNGERNLLIYGKDNKLYNYNYSTNKICNNWNIQHNFIGQKFFKAQATRTQDILVCNASGIYEFNTVSNKITQLITQHHIKCVCSTKDGYIIVGNIYGDISIYEKNGTRINKFFGFGDEVKYLDVTMNGVWLIATYQSYLILYKLIYRTENDVVNCYQDNKILPQPLIFTLKQEDLTILLEHEGGVDFRGAKFNTAENKIWVSSGSFVIRWKFRERDEGEYAMNNHLNKIVNFDVKFNSKNVIAMYDDMQFSML